MKVLLLLILLTTLGACGGIPQGGTTLVTEATDAVQPFGYAMYCAGALQQNAAAERQFRDSFCHSTAQSTVVQMTPDRARELEEVQKNVNAAITYSPTTVWDPLAARGDCKTFAARKELELLGRGWPAGALRIATAFVDDGGRQQYVYHAVLLADTDQGTIVLDSRQSAPRRWEDVSYIWMTAQTAGRGDRWVRLAADPAKVRIALAANTNGGIASASRMN
jgi:predicted transglutaminase-like cysteine proteinase